MREPNLGITMSCGICGRRFWCEDGIPICSASCDRRHEEMIEEEEREREREEKIKFCEEVNKEFGAYPEDTDFEYMTDEELQEAFDLLDCLWAK